MCLAAVRLHRRFFAAAIDSAKTGSAAGSTRRQRHVFMVTAAGLSSSVLRECVSAAAAATFTWSSSKKVQAGRSGVAERRAGAPRSSADHAVPAGVEKGSTRASIAARIVK